MKRTLFSIIALMLLIGVVSCKKEDDDPIGGSTENIPIQPVPYADGVYNPMMRIVQIIGNNETENWSWNNNKLASIQSDYVSYEFSYKGDQMGQAIVGGTNEVYGGLVEMTTDFSYNGNQLTKIENTINDNPIVTMTLLHNANNKINYSEIEMDPTQLATFIQELLGNLNPNKSNEHSPKLEFSDNNISSTFNWNGNNMSQMIVDANVDIAIKLGDIQEFTELIGGENLGSLGDILALINNLPADTELPINLGILDTVDYTYDNRNNPYYGLLYYELGATNLMLKGLSQNNILTRTIHGAANITIHIPIIGDHTFSYPVPTQTQSISYEYNANGFPTKVEDHRGNYSITYSE